MFRWYNISPCSELLLQSLSSDVTKYLADKRFSDILEYWGKYYIRIRALADSQDMELARVAQAVLLMVHMLLYESNNIHNQLEPSDAVFILQEHFPSALKDICDLKTSSWQILRKTFLDAAVARGDITWTKSLLAQGVLPYSNAHLLDIALSTKDSAVIDLLWQAGFAHHVSFRDLDNMDTDVRFAVLCNLLRSKVTRPTQLNMVDNEYSRLVGLHCGIVLVEAASKGRTIEVTVLMDLYGSAIDRRWLGVALRAAAGFRHFQTAEHLINSGADIHSSGRFGLSTLFNLDTGTIWQRMTPIQLAAEKNDIDLVRLVLYHGAEADSFRAGASTDSDDLTPLQYAARNCNFDMARVLLDAGSHPDSGERVTEADTPLQISIRRDDERTCGLLLSSGADVNSRPAWINGRTALQAAAGTGNIPVAQMLIQKGATLNAAPGIKGGMTALQAAAFGGHSTMIELLFANGADINVLPAPWGRGMTALQAAAAGGHHEIVKTLIKLGADVKGPVSHEGKTVLEAAVPHQDITMLETLITHGAEADTAHSFLHPTALEIASQIAWLEGAKYLLHCGAKVDLHIKRDGRCIGSCMTALDWAIKNNDYPMVQLLLGNSAVATITSTDFTRRFLYHSLSNGNDAAIVKLLLQHVPDPQKTIRDGHLLQTAIYGAHPHLEVYKLLLEQMAVLPKPIRVAHAELGWRCISTGHLFRRIDRALIISIADLLMDAGVNIGECLKTIGTCLQVALRQGDEDFADYLLSRGAHWDGPATEYCGTPLQEAVASGCYNIVPKLLQNGAEVNAAPCLDRPGAMTALQAAADKGLMNVARILLEAGADAAACHNGRTAIDIAARKGRFDMVALLLKSLPEVKLIATCEVAACEAESENYAVIAKWLREYAASRARETMEL